METKELQEVLRRVSTWPEAAQEEALHSLQIIEEDFVIEASLARDLERSDKEIARTKENRKKKCLNDSVSDHVWSSCLLLPQKTTLHDCHAKLKNVSQ